MRKARMRLWRGDGGRCLSANALSDSGNANDSAAKIPPFLTNLIIRHVRRTRRGDFALASFFKAVVVVVVSMDHGAFL